MELEENWFYLQSPTSVRRWSLGSSLEDDIFYRRQGR